VLPFLLPSWVPSSNSLEVCRFINRFDSGGPYPCDDADMLAWAEWRLSTQEDARRTMMMWLCPVPEFWGDTECIFDGPHILLRRNS